MRAVKRRILHIFARSNPDSDQFERVIDGQQWKSLVAPDAYAGLARLVRQGPEEFLAVLVWLDGLGPAEREFFQLVTRRFKHLPVFVYSTSPAAIDVSSALAAGAGAEVNPQALIQALAPAPDHPRPRDTAGKEEGPPAGSGPECGPPPVLPPASAQEGPRVAGLPGGSLNPFEQGLARAAAARDQPGRADQRPLSQGDAEARALLTDEELQALLGSEEDQAEKTRQPSRPGE
jgi:hypothetical protein